MTPAIISFMDCCILSIDLAKSPISSVSFIRFCGMGAVKSWSAILPTYPDRIITGLATLNRANHPINPPINPKVMIRRMAYWVLKADNSL